MFNSNRQIILPGIQHSTAVVSCSSLPYQSVRDRSPALFTQYLWCGNLATASPTKVSRTEDQLCSHNICGVGTLLQPPLPKSRGQKTSSVHTIICGVGTLLQPPLPKSRGQKTSSVHTIICGVGTLPHAHSPECRECAQAPSGRICRSAPLSQRTAAAR